MSVIVTDAAVGFELKDLGPVQEAAEKLLRERIAPEGSNKTAQLIEATQKCDLGDSPGSLSSLWVIADKTALVSCTTPWSTPFRVRNGGGITLQS